MSAIALPKLSRRVFRSWSSFMASNPNSTLKVAIPTKRTNSSPEQHSNAFAACSVEDMCRIFARLELDGLARREHMPIAKQRQNILAADMREDHGFRTGRLDDTHLAFKAIVGKFEML